MDLISIPLVAQTIRQLKISFGMLPSFNSAYVQDPLGAGRSIANGMQAQ